MKIGIFTECFEPVINGVVHSIESTKHGLEDLGHEVYIFTPDYKNKNIRKARVYPCPSFPLFKTGYHYVQVLPELIRKIASEMDIFHTHHPFTMGQRAMKLARDHNKPFILTNHTQYSQYVERFPFGKRLAKRVLFRYLRKFCDKTTLIVAPSHGIAKVIRNYGTKTKIEVVPNGIEIERFQEKDLPKPKALEKVEKKKTIIFVGRVCYEKNIDFLIKSFQKVVKDHPDARLVIVGDGPAFNEFKNLTKELKIEENVIMTGAIPYPEIRNFYPQAEFFVSASKTEVHPMVGIEAVAAGLPIVSLESVGYEDIIRNGKTGYLTSENEDGYAKRIIELLDDPAKVKKMSEESLKESKKYSVKAAAKNMLAAYKKAIKINKKIV